MAEDINPRRANQELTRVKIIAAMDKRGVSRKQLSDAANIHQSYISRTLKPDGDERLGILNTQKIATALDLDWKALTNPDVGLDEFLATVEGKGTVDPTDRIDEIFGFRLPDYIRVAVRAVGYEESIRRMFENTGPDQTTDISGPTARSISIVAQSLGIGPLEALRRIVTDPDKAEADPDWEDFKRLMSHAGKHEPNPKWEAYRQAVDDAKKSKPKSKPEPPAGD